MADANLKALTAHPERHITIQQSLRYQRFSSRPRKRPPLYPWIKLAGRWLELAGFEAGQRVRVAVEHGRLVITPA
jgi:toxic protein SymE